VALAVYLRIQYQKDFFRVPARRPAAEKALKGTLRKSRETPCLQKNQGVKRPLRAVSGGTDSDHVGLPRLTQAPSPPSYLSAQAKREWKRIAPEVVRVGVTSADLRALGLLVEALATETALRGMIAVDGATIAAGSGGRKGHPALAALAQVRQQAHKLMFDFGLIPRGRITLPPAQKLPEINRFSDLGQR
jgi:P27 family predicted phage terminase small subunit